MSQTYDIKQQVSSVLTEEKVRHLCQTAVASEPAFRIELTEVLREAVSQAEREIRLLQMRTEAANLESPQRWQPSDTSLQQGRALLLQDFTQPRNLPLPAFVKLAHKSRQQIYKDITARRLLALSVGKRGLRLPDWQLQDAPLALTRAVLARAVDVEAWTLYRALSAPSAAFDGRSPVEAVRPGSVEKVSATVLDALGLH